METEKLEPMVSELVEFLKKEHYWETDTAILYNGKKVSHEGAAEGGWECKGAAHMWFEGPLNHALNYGVGDPQYKIYNGLKAIMEKHGFYPEFGSHCNFNIYPLAPLQEANKR